MGRGKSYKEALIFHRKLLIASESAVMGLNFFFFYFYVYGQVQIQKLGALDALVIISLPLIFFLSFSSSGAWNIDNIQAPRDGIPKTTVALFRAAVLITAIAFIFHLHTSRLFILGNLISNMVLIILLRTFLGFLFAHLIKSAKAKRVLIIGEVEESEDLDFLVDRNVELDLIYYPIQKIGDSHDWLLELEKTIVKYQVDSVIIKNRTVSDSSYLLDISHFYNLGVSEIYLGSKLAYLIGRLEQIGDPTRVFIANQNLRTNGALFKRIFDICFSLFFLIILSPLMILTSIAVFASSRGPLIYGAKRVGLDNKLFYFPKFRTMYKDADRLRQEIIVKLDEDISTRYKFDPRITPVGKFLRRWSLDELPQLFCVLFGTMSIVGPRPILPEELELVPANYEFRFYAKPGLTGLWQISGRKEVDWQSRMAQDVEYIESWSVVRDFYYIYKTFRAIIQGNGAY